MYLECPKPFDTSDLLPGKTKDYHLQKEVSEFRAILT